jgi:hypothetical protein
MNNKNRVAWFASFFILFLTVECSAASKPLSDELSLEAIIEDYKAKYYDQNVSDAQLLTFFTEEIGVEYLKQKENRYRFLEGFLPMELNAPILIAEPEIRAEKDCKDVYFDHAPSSSRCLLIVGKTIYGVKKNIVIVFSASNGAYKISTIGTFTRLKD